MTNSEFIKSITLENEEWRDVVGFEGSYIVSNLGRIVSVPRIRDNRFTDHCVWKGRLIKQHLCKTGYYVVDLHYCSQRKTIKVHRVIAEAFIPKVDGKDFIDHINGIRTDNRIENLRWCTTKENLNFTIAKHNMSLVQKGKKLSSETKLKIVQHLIGHPVSLKTRELIAKAQYKKIAQYSLDNKLIKIWDSALIIEKELGFPHKGISACCCGARKTCRGYVWKHIE